MSGGSYDYFYSRATEKASSIASTLSDMASVAKKVGAINAMHHLQAASRTADMLTEQLRRLEDVTQSVEWYRSGDWAQEDIEVEALKLCGPVRNPHTFRISTKPRRRR